MSTYFIRRHNENQGPYSLEQLKGLNIQAHEYVWREGMTQWQKASSVLELATLFVAAAAPPAFINQPIAEERSPSYFETISTSKSSTIGYKPFLWTLLAIVALVLGYNFFHSADANYVAASFKREKTPEELRQELLQKERDFPTTYLIEKTTMRENLVGQKVFEGVIKNTASVAAYKDIKIEICFLSKTNAVLERNGYTLYEVVAPNQTIDFKEKIYPPADAEGFRVEILSAKAVQ